VFDIVSLDHDLVAAGVHDGAGVLAHLEMGGRRAFEVGVDLDLELVAVKGVDDTVDDLGVWFGGVGHSDAEVGQADDGLKVGARHVVSRVWWVKGQEGRGDDDVCGAAVVARENVDPA
jgi:hypothetical protein